MEPEPGAPPAGVADALARLAELIATGQPPLDAAALQIARLADPGADLDAARAELDRLAVGVTDVDGLVVRLYSEEGFAGDRENYYDPRNSSLVEVLTRRRGIPITLAVVVVEVGRRAGLPLAPVGMPGHFLIHPQGSAWYLDPFTGELLDLEDCERLFRASTRVGRDVPFHPALLVEVDALAVLVRMLTNLRLIHRAAGRVPELRWVLEARLLLPDVGADEVLELAITLGRRGDYLAAARLLDEWAERLPREAPRLTRHARAWRAHLS